jgi:hypothetical protein
MRSVHSRHAALVLLMSVFALDAMICPPATRGAGPTAGQPGRWKLDGTNCYWDPNDDGPAQCDPNARLCKALLDRITDRAHIIETGTDSYRFRRTVEKRRKKT